jgi:hypothetical protein
VSGYAKTAMGETLRYRPPNLHAYAGEPLCLRITPGDIDLHCCFFVYLDERFEMEPIGKLFQSYFFTPGPAQEEEMASWMEPWLRIDPMLPKKRMLLRQMYGRVRQNSGKVLYYINNGPGPINPNDAVGDHLGTSVFADGSFDDKILDVVLEFHAGGGPPPELAQWRRFDPTNTAGVTGPTSRVRRRKFLARLALALVGILTIPFLIFSCQDQNNGGRGFGGGML